MARKYSRKNKSNNTKKRTRLLNKKVYKVSTKKVRVNKKKRTIKKKIKGGANAPTKPKEITTFNIIPIEQGPTDEKIKNYIYKSDNATDIMFNIKKDYNEKLNKIKKKYEITIKLDESLNDDKNELTDEKKSEILEIINTSELYASFDTVNNNSKTNTEKNSNDSEIRKINDYNYAYNISEKKASFFSFKQKKKYSIENQNDNIQIENKIIKNSTKLNNEFREYIQEKNRFYRYILKSEESNYKVKIVYEIDTHLSTSRNTKGGAKNFKLYYKKPNEKKDTVIFILPATEKDNKDELSNPNDGLDTPYKETKLINDIQELIDLEIIKLETNDNTVQIKDIFKNLENDEISEIIFKNQTENQNES